MGSGASAQGGETMKDQKDLKDLMPTDKNELDNWLKVKDVGDLKQAKQEIERLRALMHKHLTEGGGSAEAKPQVARAAIMDKAVAIDISNYKKITFEKSEEVQAMLKSIMSDNILFRNAKREERGDILDAFEAVEYKAGSYVITQGETGEHFYAVGSGSLKAYINTDNGELHVASYDTGKGFGELALMYNTPRAASVKATTDCTLYRIDRVQFRTIMMYYQKARQDRYIGFVKGVSIGDKSLDALLSNDQLSQLASALEVEFFEAGETIIRQGEPGDYFYIIEEGTVEITKKAETTNSGGRKSIIGGAVEFSSEITTGAYFGEKALLAEDTRQASCTAKTACKCLSLGREDFVAMLGNVAELGGTAPAEEDPMFAAAAGAGMGDGSVKLADITPGPILGCGAFGKVRLCESKTTGECYAQKQQTKRAIIENCLQDHILNERKILIQLDHQFILKFVGEDQDDTYIYFFLELLLGGELFTHLRSRKRFLEKEAKFYAAQVLLAFQHIHKKKIAYRDLKPENLVLTPEGYCKVVDFGLAKVVDGKTWTLCGTPDYLAPEIILNEGHDKAVDYWALGVLIYEMVSGEPPFYADDPMEVYEKILSATMQIPSHFSKNLADIVKKLLKIYQSKRLGNGKGGCSAIVKHKWFYGFDWELLLTKSMSEDQIPINPKCKGPKDIGNFDPYDETEEQEPACEPPWWPEFD